SHCSLYHSSSFSFFFFNDPAPPPSSPLSLHDALPICLEGDRRLPHHAPVLVADHPARGLVGDAAQAGGLRVADPPHLPARAGRRSEEHTSELQSLAYLVCRLLLEKKKKKQAKKVTPIE